MKVILRNSAVVLQKHAPVEVTYQVTTPDVKLFSDYVFANFKTLSSGATFIEIKDIESKQYNGLQGIAVKKGDIMVATKDAAATTYQVGFATSLENGTPITPASAYPTPSGDSTFTCPSDGYYLWYGGAANPFNFVQKIMRTTLE